MNQRGFTNIFLIALIIISFGVAGFFIFVKKSTYEDKWSLPILSPSDSSIQSIPSNGDSPFTGLKRTFVPEKIVSIDPIKKTFVLNLESRQEPFIIPTEFRVLPETVIKKENRVLGFDGLAVNDMVWIRAVIEDTIDMYVAQHVIVTSYWQRSQVIIKRIYANQNQIVGEIFLPREKRGQQTTLTIIPETEIRKGKAEEGSNRSIVGLRSLAIGDIASITEISQKTYAAGLFYTTDIDVVSPYPCEKYLKPPGCIEK